MAQSSWSGVVLVGGLLFSCSRGPAADLTGPDPITRGPVEVQDSAVARVAVPEVPPAPSPPPLSALATISYSPESARSVSEVLAVTVKVELRGSQGPHELIANFEAPGSLPFERRAKPLDGSAFDTHVVEFVLPVAGTMIAQQPVTGTWAVALYHDGEKLSAPTFELAP
jgi:hypothetical protein